LKVAEGVEIFVCRNPDLEFWQGDIAVMFLMEIFIKKPGNGTSRFVKGKKISKH